MHSCTGSNPVAHTTYTKCLLQLLTYQLQVGGIPNRCSTVKGWDQAVTVLSARGVLLSKHTVKKERISTELLVEIQYGHRPLVLMLANKPLVNTLYYLMSV